MKTVIYILVVCCFSSLKIKAQAYSVSQSDSTVIERDVTSKVKRKKIKPVTTSLRKGDFNGGQNLIYDPKLKSKNVDKNNTNNPK